MPDPQSLPAPAPLARALLRRAWGPDADAVCGDLAESLALRRAAGRSSGSVWLQGWWEVLAAVVHGLGAPPVAATAGAASRGSLHRGGGGPGRGRRRGLGLQPILALRLAVRGLVRDPGTSVAAAGILALGLAAAATFFAILNGLHRPLPVPEGHRIVRADVVQPARDGRALAVTGADLVAWNGVPGLEGLGGVRDFGAKFRDPGRFVARVAAAAITPGALELLGVRPVAGRFPGADEADGAILVGAALVDELWADGVDPLGRTVEVDGRPGVVTAVMPEDFGFPFRQSLWVVERPETHRDATYEAVGRLASGADPAAAAAQLQARWSGLDDARLPEDVDGVVLVRGYTEARGESGESILFIGLVLIGVALLFIACANVANLLLVRATERVGALGVQAALGAGRGQLALQLLLEALLLALVGGAVGLGMAALLAGWVDTTMGPENFGYYWIRMTVDGRVTAFTGGLVVAVALLAGLLPIVRVLGRDLRGLLENRSDRSPASGGGRWGRVFVGGQLALSCAALVAAGLTARAMAAARDFGRGVPAAEVIVGGVVVEGDDAAARRRAVAQLGGAARAVEGARFATVALGAPGYRELTARVDLDGIEPVPDRPRDFTFANAVAPGFFELFDLDLRLGRLLGADDGPGAEPVAVVNEAFAARFWPDGSPLGRRVRVEAVGGDTWLRVVGVVEDADLGEGPGLREDRVYLPLGQVDAARVYLLARAADGDGENLAGPLRRAMALTAPDLPLADVRTLESGHAFMTRAQGTFSTLAMAGGSSGLVVAVVGLYGLLAFRVRQRRRELGVRKALGADGPTLVREVLGSAIRQLAPAVVGGLVLAWLAAPFLGVILLGGDPRSPLVFGGVALVFLAAGLGAALVPALRAGRVEPAGVLRSE